MLQGNQWSSVFLRESHCRELSFVGSRTPGCLSGERSCLRSCKRKSFSNSVVMDVSFGPEQKQQLQIRRMPISRTSSDRPYNFEDSVLPPLCVCILSTSSLRADFSNFEAYMIYPRQLPLMALFFSVALNEAYLLLSFVYVCVCVCLCLFISKVLVLWLLPKRSI